MEQYDADIYPRSKGQQGHSRGLLLPGGIFSPMLTSPLTSMRRGRRRCGDQVHTAVVRVYPVPARLRESTRGLGLGRGVLVPRELVVEMSFVGDDGECGERA